MYSLTIIRLNSETKVFENTEFNGLETEGGVYNEISSYGCPIEHLEKFKALQKGDRMTAESDITNGIKRGLRFFYINRIS